MSPDWTAKPTAVPYAQFGNPQSLNRYSYVGNNPINRTDADGHCYPFCDVMERVVTAAAAFSAKHPDVGKAYDKVVSSLSVKVSLGVGGQVPKSSPVSGSGTATVYVGGSKEGLNVGLNGNGTGKLGPAGGQINIDVPIVKNNEIVNPFKDTTVDVSPVLEGEKGKAGAEASVGKEEASVGGTYGEGVVGGLEFGASAEALGNLGVAIFSGIVSDIRDTIQEVRDYVTMPAPPTPKEPERPKQE